MEINPVFGTVEKLEYQLEVERKGFLDAMREDQQFEVVKAIHEKIRLLETELNNILNCGK